MYAVIETGGKQYRVVLGQEIEVDRLDAEPGQTIDLPRVLLVADGDATAIGRPVVDGARVSAAVVRQDRGEKVVVFKYKPKTRRRVKKGSRAELTVLRIAEIAWDGRSAAQEDAAQAEERRRASEAAAATAAEKAAADQALAAQLAAAAAPVTPAGTTRTPRRARAAGAAAPPADEAATDGAGSDESAAGESVTAADEDAITGAEGETPAATSDETGPGQAR
jgi:large subunit ribosomal protein L21